MQRISILFPTALETFDYLTPFSVKTGDFVLAPFGKQTKLGIVWNTPPDVHFPASKLKTIISNLKDFKLPLTTITFINWVSKYTLFPKGSILKMTLSPEMIKQSKHKVLFEKPTPFFHSFSFSEEQKKALEKLLPFINNTFNPILLDGVTGSGKTEIYFESIAKVLSEGKQILVLLPEISLTPDWLERFKNRFGIIPAVWNSSITPKQKRDIWQSILNEENFIIVGARSALFLPFKNLGLIIVDEEHDSSFKQEEGILYNARDMAVVRANLEKCPIILSSATPSLESYCNAKMGKYHLIELKNRFHGSSLPTIEIIDMRYKGKSQPSFLSQRLITKLSENLHNQGQSLLFINRRGYAPLVLCHSCGEKIKCPHCSVFLTEHKEKKQLICHHCGYTQKFPQRCPHCQEENSFISYGAGVERVFEETKKHFPTARIVVISSDILSQKETFKNFMEQMLSHEIDIVIGTQILAKGHNFPDLNLVGIIDADMTLMSGDLRASERTFQLLHQVIGRAGRITKTGSAFLQTYTPDNQIIQALSKNDRSQFLNTEIQARQLLNMPPFGKLTALIITGRQEKSTLQLAEKIVQKGPYMKGVDILGPTTAPLSRLNKKYRFRILIKSDKKISIQPILQKWLSQISIPSSISVKIDIDPYSFI